MFSLNLETILVSYSLCNCVCAIVLFSLWKQNRSRFAGLNYYMASFAINFLGITLLALRGLAPDFISILIGNVFLIAGVFLLFWGLSRFLDRNIFKIPNIVILVLYVFVQAWFIYGHPDMRARIILFSATLSLYCIQISWLLFSTKDVQIRKITFGLGVISIIYWVINLARIGLEFVNPEKHQLFGSFSFEPYIYLLFQLIYIVLTFYIFMMVNRRLVLNLEEDIIERESIRQELNKNKEKFLKAFKSSPVPILISRMEDGEIFDANDAFIKLSGFKIEEIITESTLHLGMWENPEERRRVVQQIKKFGNVDSYPFLGRNKNGELLHLVFSGESVLINDEMCLISSIQDVTEHFINEKIMKLRLLLWEYSSNHTIIELMTRALDEIEELTKSSISFFHFVIEEEKSLKLQTWSTQTKRTFCKAEGEGAHYDLNRAGIWADSVRIKKPVIHNDYQSVQNKKGLPEGHAQIVRELVVPVIYNEKVEAVLGVGNKKTNYEEKDVELVEVIANLVWIIVKQKQTDDQIVDLNGQLEQLAMTDELTKIDNRRAFFIKGNNEVQRARRYHLPLSMIMMDIDQFKNINDTFGHDIGDQVLQCVAETMKKHSREVDVVGRLGGEEFGILLPNTKEKDAAILAERIRTSIESHHCMKEELQTQVTASFGVAEYHLEMKTLDELMKCADSAMYLAKRNGRNQVQMFQQQ